MACNYCKKIEGLPKIDHVLNVNGKQLYKCPMCTEFLMVMPPLKSKGYIPPSKGWNPAKGYVGAGMGGGLTGFVPMPGSFGIKAPTAKQANATPVKEPDASEVGPKIIYCGYDSAGIEKMIGDYQTEDYMTDVTSTQKERETKFIEVMRKYNQKIFWEMYNDKSTNKK